MHFRTLQRLFKAPENKVLGVGWAKTGTTSLGVCLKRLGRRHTSMRLDLVDDWAVGDHTEILSIARRFDSFEDWPWLLLYKEFDRAFPGTKFILTTRESDSWVRSYLNQIHQPGHFTPEMNRLRELLYGMSFASPDPEKLIARYEAHNAEVREYFRDRPGDLLEVNWAKGDGWKEVCEFLGERVPSGPFPHAHRGIYHGAAVGTCALIQAMGEVAVAL